MRPVHGGGWWAPVVLVVACLLWTGPATAPAAAETTLQVEAGYGGWFTPGQDVPVRVRVGADRLLKGSLEVAVGDAGNGLPVAIAVEVPGGSEKEFLLTAPSGLAQNPEVTARLRQNDRVLASGRSSVLASVETELVGILPGALRGRAVPGQVTLAVDAGTARFAALGEAELAAAPDSLGPLSTLIADPDELDRMSPGARSGVLRWVEAGGRLLVDSARGQRVPGLPDAWQPGPRGRAPAGLGEVVAVDGAVAAGRWPGLVEPSWRSASTIVQSELPLAGSLAADAGLRSPELGWLVGFLAVYVVAVGPVLFFAVRRRGRPELAWVAVPLVALLFSAGSYVVGRDLRSATQLVHASVLSSGTAGPSASTWVGVFSRSGETVRVGFPAAWSNGPYGEASNAPGPTLLTRTADGPEARLPLDAGQFGLVRGSGPVAEDASIEVTATAGAGGRVTGTARNATPYRLGDVAVFMGSDAVLLGSLGPGEQRSFALTSTGQFSGEGVEFRVWASPRSGDPESRADFSLWQSAVRSHGSNFLAPGAVVAAGWTRDFVPDVRIDGRARRPQGGTLVLGRQQAGIAPDGSLGPSVRREVVRDPFARGAFGVQRTGAVVRFLLPEGADTSKLVLKNPFGMAELWQGGAWQPAACSQGACLNGGRGPACPPGAAVPCPPPLPAPVRIAGPAEHTVPPAAVRDGVVYVRVQGPASGAPGATLSIERSA